MDFVRMLASVREELAHMETVPVYFALSERSGEVKIGFSTQVQNRIYLLQQQRLSPTRLLGWVLGGPRVEREMHAKFADFALGREWFEPDPELLHFIADHTRHDDPPGVASIHGRITDWGYDRLIGDEALYLKYIEDGVEVHA